MQVIIDIGYWCAIINKNDVGGLFMKKIGELKTYASKDIDKNPVSIGFECMDRDVINPDKCYKLLGESGVKHARCQTGWVKCETQKGVYDFSWLDKIVDTLISMGIKPWFNVGFGNPIYMPDVPNPSAVGCMPIFYGDEVVTAWKKYIRAMAKHYKGRVEYFEIWNETDLTHFCYPGEPDPKTYAEFIVLTGDEIKKEIPNAKIGACTAGSQLHYMIDLFATIPAGKLDFYGFHTYSLMPEDCGIITRHKILREVLNYYGHKNTEIWTGECGHASWHPDGHWMVHEGGGSERRQAVWQLRRYFTDFNNHFPIVSFFQIADMMEKPYEKAKEVLKFPARQGILNGKVYTPKLSYYTISRLSTVFAGDFEITAIPFEIDFDTEFEKIKMSYKKGENDILAYWLKIEIAKETPLESGAKIDIRNTNIKNPIAIDMFDGSVYKVDFDKKAKTVLDAPIGDYPILICDESAFEF